MASGSREIYTDSSTSWYAWRLLMLPITLLSHFKRLVFWLCLSDVCVLESAVACGSLRATCKIAASSSCSSSSSKRAVVLTQQSQSELVLGIVATASRQIFHWPLLYASLQTPRGGFGSLLETLFAEHDPQFLRVQSPQQMKRRSRNLAVGKCCLQKSGLKKRLGFTLCSWIHTGG